MQVHNDQGIGPDDLFERDPNGIWQIQSCRVLHLFNEVRQNFSVGFAHQVMTAMSQRARGATRNFQ